jgi:hypothetical protein
LLQLEALRHQVRVGHSNESIARVQESGNEMDVRPIWPFRRR